MPNALAVFHPPAAVAKASRPRAKRPPVAKVVVLSIAARARLRLAKEQGKRLIAEFDGLDLIVTEASE